MNKKRPLLITFIGDISFLLSLLSIIVGLFPHFLTQIGFYIIPLPAFPGSIIMILLPIILLIASVGFLRLKRWGYWLMVIYNIFFLALNIILWQQNIQLFLPQNFLITIIELIFIIPTKKYFDKEIPIS